MDGAGARVSVVVPVHEDAGTLRPLAERLAATLAGRDWRLRLVIDASTDESTAVARELAARSPRIAVSGLTVSDGGDDALVRGLSAESGADAWVCLDAGFSDPPEHVPAMLDRLLRGDVGAVFAARPGGCPRLLLGVRHRLTGLPAGAGRFLAMAGDVRDSVLAAVREAGAPSVALAVTRSGTPLATVPVPLERRPTPRGLAGARHSARSVAWAVRARGR
jgi:glycosyltransferase involved in cell wall biosynthesis